MYIIIARNPSNDRVVAVTDDDENIAVFKSFAEADQAADNTAVCKAWPYAIVETP